MDSSKTNNLRICCPEGTRSQQQLQLGINKDKLDFFKDILQLVDIVEKGNEEVGVSLCPVAIRLENKYKCCKARVTDIEGKLEKVEKENETLKYKLNAIDILSKNQYSEFVRVSEELEIQILARFEAETKLKQMVTHFKDVSKVIADLVEPQLGDNKDQPLPQANGEVDSPAVCEGESVNIFAELTTLLNDQFQKWKNIQMKTRSESRTLFENLKKIEEGLLKNKSLNAKELARVDERQSNIGFLQEICSEVPIIKPVAKPSLQMQGSAERNFEISGNENNEQQKQIVDQYSKTSVNEDRYSRHKNSSTDATNSNQIHQREELLQRESAETMALPRVREIPSEKVTILRKMNSSKTSEAPVIRELLLPFPSSILIQRSADRQFEISTNKNNEQNSADKILHSTPIDEQCVDKPCISGHVHNVDDNECASQDNVKGNTEATFSKEHQQQSASSGPSQDKQPNDKTTVKENHYRILTEGDMDGNRFVCKCGKSYSFMLSLDQHIYYANRKAKHNAFSCQICGRILSSKQSLQNHLKNHMGQRDHKCEICDKTFVSKAILTFHVKTHSGENKKECSICGRKFLRKYNLNEHMRTHTNEKPYKCNSCGKYFATSGYLKLHQITHSGEKPYKCLICSASFGLKRNLKIHERIHNNVRLYSCSKCHLTFRHRSSLRSHVSTHHSPNRIPAFHCIFCDKALQTKGGYYQHIRAHVGELRVFCEYCDKGFSDKFSKEDHIRRRHSSRKATRVWHM